MGKGPIELYREFQDGEFDPDSMNKDDINDRAKLVNFYLTDMWGYTPDEIQKFTDRDINDAVNGIYGNVNLSDLRNKWTTDEIGDHIRSLIKK